VVLRFSTRDGSQKNKIDGGTVRRLKPYRVEYFENNAGIKSAGDWRGNFKINLVKTLKNVQEQPITYL
jgi:hypothetical protein